MAARPKPRTRRVTVNLPVGLLERARSETGLGITETLVAGLELLRQRAALRELEKLRGKLDIEIDVDELRGRARH